jgi:hypothetical protein
MVLPVVNAAMFVVAVAVVSVSSLSANTVYELWEVGAYPVALQCYAVAAPECVLYTPPQ